MIKLKDILNETLTQQVPDMLYHANYMMTEMF